jgi:hypothetical protein
MVGMAAVGMALGSTPAWSVPPPQLPQITCVGNGPSTENGDPVTAAATFILDKTVVPTKLTLVLSNTSGVKTPNQGGVLTGVVFNIGNNSVVLNPNQQLVTPMLTAPSFAYDNAGVIASPGLTNRWTSRINPGVYHYGVATTGFGGYFDAAGIGGQSDYGMVAPGTFPTTFPNTPYIQNSLSFMFTTNGDFNVGDIKDVGALFGTQPGSGGPAILSCIQNDFGDAPDPGLGTAPGTSTTPPNYNTRLADGGPSHTLGEEVYLGLVKPDGDDGTLQNSTATDDNNTATNDEDGIDLKNLPTLLTTTTSVKMNVKATNLTSAGAILACWIDFNRSGIFGEPMAGELATAVVPAGTAAGTIFVLNFNAFVTPLTAGPTAVRCRISIDPDWKAAPTPVGSAENGEVEDYMANGIYEPCVTSPITSLPAAPPLFSGVQFTVSPNGSMSGGIASIQCQKTINIDPATGISFVPPGTLVVASTPPTWTFTPAAGAVQVTARKMSTASGTIACTATDSMGNTCSTDPWFATGLRLKGSGSEVTVSQLISGVSREDDFVTITNNQPGIRKLEISVNSRKFKVNSLQDGEVKTLCITSAMRDDTEGNSIYIVAKGRPGGSAEVMGEPGNGRCK